MLPLFKNQCHLRKTIQHNKPSQPFKPIRLVNKSSFKNVKSSSFVTNKRTFATQGAEEEEEGLENTQTFENLREALAAKGMSRARFTYFANKADLEGYSDAARTFKDLADSDAAHANGHMFYLEEVGDPVTTLPIGQTVEHLRAAIASKELDVSKLYESYMDTAREERLQHIEEWFKSLQDADRRSIEKLRSILAVLENEPSDN
eukprot:TRINITY_DN14961_c0_g1_i1.p1 TRINITY_DN14961_c0_g1~~TRINITY_DN14961_c0_g1_i1.p1  ORF type:complete len:204 (+),score=65.37 TRINITY_DN14961_c0_g1_i1:74-685(+)